MAGVVSDRVFASSTEGLEFSIRIQSPRGRTFPVTVIDSPAGQGKGRLRLLADLKALRFAWSDPDPDWEAFQREDAWRPGRRLDKAKEIGGRLFTALFSGQVRRLYERSLGILEASAQAGLRLRLHFDVGDKTLASLAALPWELLFDAERGRFLALDRRTPLVRALDLPLPERPLDFGSPLRILLAAAQPAPFAPLDLERERRRILSAWTEKTPALLDVLEHASPTSLRDALLAGRHQVLHFLGHGKFQPSTGQGSLLFEREGGTPFPVVGPLLGNLLAGLPEIRFVVLNACETARLRADGREPFAAVATALVQAGIPATVAMGAAVKDRAAVAFAARLYGRLAAGDSVEAAVTEARLAISAERQDTVDWAIPVLFLRGPGGALTPRQAKRQIDSGAPGFPRGPFMPEGPPEDFVDRPELTAPVIAGLLATDVPSMVGLTAAFRGAGGYGKTTLARAVCQDPRIRRAFPDGILWVTLGERPENLIGVVEDLIYTLARERPGFSNLESAAASLAAHLEPRRALLVIDDVWSPTHLRPFLRGGPRCARLVTTRDRTVLPATATVVQVDAMQRDEALRLLAVGLPGEQRPALENLAKKLGYWPLLLRLVNGVLRDRLLEQGQTLAAALVYVSAALGRGLTAFDVSDPADRTRAVASTLAVSLDQLPPEARERFLDLAIFPEDSDVPFSALDKLWTSLAAVDVEAFCVRLHQLSLLFNADLSRRSIRLHDVIRSFLRAHRASELRAVHRRFLDPARQEVAGVWRNLPAQDTYLWRHLSYHLEGAGLGEELAATVQDLSFLVSRVASGDPHGAEGDLVRAQRMIAENSRLRALHAVFANAKHLLIPCKDPEEIIETLASRLVGVNELRDFAAAGGERFERPRLRPRFPLPDSPDPALLRTLASFGGQVDACSVSADGDKAVTACEDGSVILWDVLLGSELWTVQEAAAVPEEGDDMRICDSYCALSADGSTLLDADGEGVVHVWDVATRVELCRLGEKGRVISAALSAYGHRGVCCWQSGRLRAFETANGRSLLEFATEPTLLLSCALSSDGRLLAATCGTSLCLWELPSSEMLRTWPAHDKNGTGCALSGNGSLALSASEDGSARLWDTATGKELRRLDHGRGLLACALSGEGNLAVTAADGSPAVVLWNCRTGERLRLLEGHLGGVACCAMDQVGDLIVTGGEDLTAKLWRDPLLIERGTAPRFQADLRDGAIDASGRLLAGAGLDATLRLWDLQTGEQILCLQHPQALSGCALSPAGDLAISVADDGGIRLWDVATSECTAIVEIGPQLLCCALSARGDLLATAERQGRISLWDLRQRKQLRILDGGPSVPTRCRFSPDDQQLLLASRDGCVRLWDLSVDSAPRIVAGHGDEVNGCAISADGELIASASHDGTVRLWSQDGQPLSVLAGHAGPVRDCAFQPNSRLLLSVSTDVGIGSTIRVWDPETGLSLASLRVEGELSGCGWLPGGDALFAVGQYGAYIFDWQP